MSALDPLNRSEPAVSQLKTKKGSNKAKSLSRRAFLRSAGAMVGLAANAASIRFSSSAWGQSADSGLPAPDEAVEATLKRLFGSRSMRPGEGKIKLELPLIAEDGGNVAVSIDANLPVSGANHLRHIYIISDKNRRPMLVKFSFYADSGKASVATSVRLATTTDVRAVVEMNDGALYTVTKNVRVTVSGCDLPPQG
jgi:sulfur-oxidizing protein SoxY